ncbi:MAG: glycine zipper 2TM domain-containing protein [Rickettsiales bacterium]|nr:glycine zipper 2TM domain-containing protein [Rickettsiales bacterium]
MMKKLVSAVLVLSMATACSQNAGRDGGIRKQDMGALTGAIAGAWIGSNTGKGKGKIVGTAVGTLLGAMAGSEIGASLDRADVAYHNRAAQTALETKKIGVASTWVNPDNGNTGTITPVRTFQTQEGRYCREYTQTISVGGRSEEGHGTACREPDGTWKIIN